MSGLLSQTYVRFTLPNLCRTYSPKLKSDLLSQIYVRLTLPNRWVYILGLHWNWFLKVITFGNIIISDNSQFPLHDYNDHYVHYELPAALQWRLCSVWSTWLHTTQNLLHRHKKHLCWTLWRVWSFTQGMSKLQVNIDLKDIFIHHF